MPIATLQVKSDPLAEPFSMPKAGLIQARKGAIGGNSIQESNLRFSIITPSFLGRQWLPLCIASVADQQGVEVEHIVQDSCSGDGTEELLRNYPNVRAYVEKDEGMYD